MALALHSITHSRAGVSHNSPQFNKGFEQGFYHFSTTFRRGYYYYLYIYKSRFQADRFHIRFPLLKNNQTPLSI